MSKFIHSDKLNEKQKKYAEEYGNKMMTILVEEMAWDKIRRDRIQVIESIYSDAELKSLIEFFESDLGKLYINKQQIAVQKLGESSQKHVQNLMHRIKEMEEEMQAELKK